MTDQLIQIQMGIVHDNCRLQETTCVCCGGPKKSTRHCYPDMCENCYRELGRDLDDYAKYIEDQDDMESVK